ncbi:MAG: Ppx/GppA family phosphatase [Bacteroidetes bacterium]|nr:Ppx/GppA family phosphatase [Bacteroidota bacterium]
MQSEFKNIFSVIDLGTNTCLLLIASLSNGKPEKIFEAQEIPRLGKDLYITGKISGESFKTTADIFSMYKSLSQSYGAGKIYAFGTSAMRDASNSREFAAFIKSRTGIEIKIISGNDEARYSYEGAVYDLNGNKEYAVIDIGGGSTEISWKESGILMNISFNAGSVRLYENFFSNEYDIPLITEESLQKARNDIKKVFENYDGSMLKGKTLAGVAGTLTTLSALINGLKEFDENIIHKDVLKREDIINVLNKLLKMNNEERSGLGSYMKGRSDVIISGILILLEIMNHFSLEEIIVSAKGLRYGLMLNLNEFN